MFELVRVNVIGFICRIRVLRVVFLEVDCLVGCDDRYGLFGKGFIGGLIFCFYE